MIATLLTYVRKSEFKIKKVGSMKKRTGKTQNKEERKNTDTGDFCKQFEGKEPDWDYGRPIFVIQKHQARNLHWDLRLEIKGVLKSWAVPKEPPIKPGVKRLAVLVEDHPLAYASFEGDIPEGDYGAGKVEIWDKGRFDMVEQNKDKIIVDIQGAKLNGIFILLSFKKAGKNNWLFFKKKN